MEVRVKFDTKRLYLRDYRETDWESVHEYGSIPEFSQYEMWGPNTDEDTKKFIADSISRSTANPRFHFEFAVCLKDGDRQIGGCGIRRDTEFSHVANLGWAINPKYQNVGYATEAASALIEFGFKNLNLKVIYATCDTRNVASYKVMEKLGMQKVGHMIGDREIDGQTLDSYRYEILPKTSSK
jgi:ribosomal-protein-alanine N-acetyltransferase